MQRKTVLYSLPSENMHMSGVYILKNTVNNFCYVGSTVRFTSRLSGHILDCKRGKGNRHLTEFIDNYGWDKVIFEILEVVEDKDTLRLAETVWIKRFDFNTLWNIAPRGDSNKGVIMPDTHKQKCSDRMTGNSINKGIKFKKSKGEKTAAYWSENPEALEKMKQVNRESQKKVDRTKWKKGKIVEVYFNDELIDTVYGLKLVVELYNLTHSSASNVLQGKLKSTKGYSLKEIGRYFIK